MTVVIKIGRVAGRFFIKMEPVEGSTISHNVKQGIIVGTFAHNGYVESSFLDSHCLLRGEPFEPGGWGGHSNGLHSENKAISVSNRPISLFRLCPSTSIKIFTRHFVLEFTSNSLE